MRRAANCGARGSSTPSCAGRRCAPARMALRGPGGPRLPGLGSNPTDGLWIDYRYPYRLGNVAGELYGKYGQISGFFLLNTLSYDQPAWRLTLDTGRTQREDPDNVV